MISLDLKAISSEKDALSLYLLMSTAKRYRALSTANAPALKIRRLPLKPICVSITGRT